MGKKPLVSLAMEGEVSTDGLQAMDDGDDMPMAMARELDTEKGIGDHAPTLFGKRSRRNMRMYSKGRSPGRLMLNPRWNWPTVGSKRSEPRPLGFGNARAVSHISQRIIG
jgi:hypothetical protein